MKLMKDQRLDRMESLLLQAKTWRYLRYLHAWKTLEKVADRVSTVCVCGAGGAYAEVAMAIRFPHIKFTITDIVDREHNYPSYQPAMSYCWKNGIDNINFSIWNVLEKSERHFDMIMSTEMLEHIQKDDHAAENIRQSADKFIYCLVPFADKATNENPTAQRRALEKAEHFRPGYDSERLVKLFGSPIEITGAYWKNEGFALRNFMTPMKADEITDSEGELKRMALDDLKDMMPCIFPEALGIKILAKCD